MEQKKLEINNKVKNRGFHINGNLFGSLLKNEGSTICLLIMFIFASLHYDYFLTARNLENLLQNASIIGVIALGMTMVILTAGIDLSVGSVFALSGVVVAMNIDLGIGTAICLGLSTGLLCGMINGLIITKLRINPFIATFAMLIAARGMCHLLSKSQVISIDESLAGGFFWLGRNEIMGLPVSGLIFITLAIIISIFLRKTVTGRNIYAIGDNEAGARICGVNIDRVKLLVYSINGLLAAFAGIILAAKLGVGQPTAGDMYEMESILAVVLGGTLITGGVGKIRGTVVGVFILIMINNIFNLEGIIETWYRNIFLGMILLTVVILQRIFLISKI